MKHIDRTGGIPFLANINPFYALLEIPRGQAGPVLAAAGFIKQYDSGDPQTVLVQVTPGSTAYNLIKAL